MGFPAIAGFIKAIFVGTTVGATIAGTTVTIGYVLAINVARLALLALVAKLTQPKLDLNARATTKTLTFADTIAPQAFGYGEDMLSGPMIFANTAGTDNRDLYMMVALVGHEVDSVISYRIDDLNITLGQLSGSEDGDVTGGDYDGVARVDFRHGTSTQVVISSLTSVFPSQFNSAHTGRGWSYMLWEFNLVEGKEEVFKNQPRNLRVRLRLKKIYDPRLDDTNGGTGPHRLDTPSTWEWSHNPALCLADFMRDDKFGMKEEDDRIDWPRVITAADICEELVDIPTAQTQERYTCNAIFFADQQRMAVRDEILGSMMGRIVFSQGVWRMWAGAAVAATVTLTEANLAGGVQLQASAPSRERYNRVRGKFVDPTRNYTASAYPEARSAAFVTEDGGEVLPQIADFTSSNTEYEAQRKAIITLKQSRNMRVLVFQGNYSCFRLQTGATVDIDIAEYGFAGEKFFITEWKMSADGIELTLVEEVDSVWDAPLEGDYSTRSATGVITFGDIGVPAPTNLTAAEIVGGVLICWDDPLHGTFTAIEIWMSYENVRGTATLIGTSPGQCYYDLSGDINRIRYYWVRSINGFGQVSDYEPDLTTTTITSIAVQAAQLLTRDPQIRHGAAGWEFEVSAGADPTYEVGLGTNGTDAIQYAGLSGSQINTNVVKRRGPQEWDVQAAQGMAIEVRFRIQQSVDETSGTFTTDMRCGVVTSEADGSNGQLYGAAGTLILLDENTPVGEWFEATGVAILDQEDSHTVKPRYINLVVLGGQNSNGAVYLLDMLDATISGRIYEGESKPGYVPAKSAAPTGQFLKDDGTWDDPPGGSGSDSFKTQTVVDVDSGYSWSATGSAVADSGTDTLDWVSGLGIDIDVDASSDAIRVTADVRTVFGRDGAVTGLQADYDSFFLTPAEGDAAYASITHIHTSFDRASSVLSGDDVFSNIVVADGIVTLIATRAIGPYNNYTHPNHSGHVFSDGDGTTTLLVAGITGQIDIGANLIATDEIIVNDGGVIRRADISRFNNYFNSVLDFESTIHTHNASDIDAGILVVARGGTGVSTSTGTGNTVRAQSPTITGNLTTATISMADNKLERPHIDDYAILNQVVTGVTSTTIDYRSGQGVSLQLGANNITTLTLSNWPANLRKGVLEILVTQGGTARTITWPGAVNWPDGTPPDLSTSNGRFLIYLTTVDNGSTIDGTYTPALS